VLTAICDHDPALLTYRPVLLILADKGYISTELDTHLAERGVRLLRPSSRNRTPRSGEHLLKPIRQLVESVNDTLKANSTWSYTVPALHSAWEHAQPSGSSP
jgi:hypothetical protein